MGGVARGAGDSMSELVDLLGVAGVGFLAYMIISVLVYAVFMLVQSLRRVASTRKPPNTGRSFHTRRREQHD